MGALQVTVAYHPEICLSDVVKYKNIADSFVASDGFLVLTELDGRTHRINLRYVVEYVVAQQLTKKDVAKEIKP